MKTRLYFLFEKKFPIQRIFLAFTRDHPVEGDTEKKSSKWYFSSDFVPKWIFDISYCPTSSDPDRMGGPI